MTDKENLPNKEILVTFTEFLQFLYKKEDDRTDRLERKIAVFTAALGGGLITAVWKFPFSTLSVRLGEDTGNGIIILSLFILSLVALLASTIFTFLVYKVRRFERLTDPKEKALKVSAMTDVDELLSSIIADYVVATNRNHAVNNQKARHLSWALLLLLSGLVLFTISLLLMHLMN